MVLKNTNGWVFSFITSGTAQGYSDNPTQIQEASLDNKPKEQTLLQVQSGKDHFSTEKLKENLQLFLTQLQNKGNEGQRKKGTLKRQAEWQKLVQDIVQKKKESNQKCVPVKKRM